MYIHCTWTHHVHIQSVLSDLSVDLSLQLQDVCMYVSHPHLPPLSVPSDSGKQTYITDDKNFFGRHFSRGEYFHCERCKEFTFTNCSEDAYVMGKCVFPCLKGADNKTTCTSTVNMMSSIIYPGDIDAENPSSECVVFGSVCLVFRNVRCTSIIVWYIRWG